MKPVKASDVFNRQYHKLTPPIQKRCRKSIKLFLANPRHPSLNFEKLRGYKDIFSIRVTLNFRIIMREHEGYFELIMVGTHDVYNRF